VGRRFHLHRPNHKLARHLLHAPPHGGSRSPCASPSKQSVTPPSKQTPATPSGAVGLQRRMGLHSLSPTRTAQRQSTTRLRHDPGLEAGIPLPTPSYIPRVGPRRGDAVPLPTPPRPRESQQLRESHRRHPPHPHCQFHGAMVPACCSSPKSFAGPTIFFVVRTRLADGTMSLSFISGPELAYLNRSLMWPFFFRVVPFA
jgi:hypothetical protein